MTPCSFIGNVSNVSNKSAASLFKVRKGSKVCKSRVRSAIHAVCIKVVHLMYQKNYRKPKNSTFIMTVELPDNLSATMFGEMELQR